MSYENPKIKVFKDLVAWDRSHKLTVAIYKATSTFPSSEQFGITNQLRRASVSIVSNIAEGFGRRTDLDKVRFYDMARASLHEVQAQLLIATDVGFLSEASYNKLEEQSQEAHKLLTGLINKTKSRGKELITHTS
jgi:four helix bundle protein